MARTQSRAEKNKGQIKVVVSSQQNELSNKNFNKLDNGREDQARSTLIGAIQNEECSWNTTIQFGSLSPRLVNHMEDKLNTDIPDSCSPNVSLQPTSPPVPIPLPHQQTYHFPIAPQPIQQIFIPHIAPNPIQLQQTLIYHPIHPHQTLIIPGLIQSQQTLISGPIQLQQTHIPCSIQPQMLMPGSIQSQQALIPGPIQAQQTLIPSPMQPQQTLIPSPIQPQQILITRPIQSQETLMPGPMQPQQTLIPGHQLVCPFGNLATRLTEVSQQLVNPVNFGGPHNQNFNLNPNPNPNPRPVYFMPAAPVPIRSLPSPNYGIGMNQSGVLFSSTNPNPNPMSCEPINLGSLHMHSELSPVLVSPISSDSLENCSRNEKQETDSGINIIKPSTGIIPLPEEKLKTEHGKMEMFMDRSFPVSVEPDHQQCIEPEKNKKKKKKKSKEILAISNTDSISTVEAEAMCKPEINMMQPKQITSCSLKPDNTKIKPKSEPDDRENQKQKQKQKILTADRKKYSRHFLLTFADRCTDLIPGFRIEPCIWDALMSVLQNKGSNSARYRLVQRSAKPGSANALMSVPQNKENSRQYRPCVSPDTDRWQHAIGSRMNRAERKYEVGKISDESESKQRLLKSILNKLTPQNFQKLFDQAKAVKIDSVNALSGIISQIFNKALMEPTFCEMYAHFCVHLAGALPDFYSDGERITFKSLLLNKCQEEFERGEREEEREEERVRAKRRMLGNVRLIGELYKKKMLAECIIHECIKKLLCPQDEENLEAICKLFDTIGEVIDHPESRSYIDSYFEMIERISESPKISSRVRFMLKDTIDLRTNSWLQRRKVEGPKKIEEVHRDAAQERLANKQSTCGASSVSSRVHENNRTSSLPLPQRNNNVDRVHDRIIMTEEIMKSQC